MAMTLRTDFRFDIFPGNAIERIDRLVQNRLTKLKGRRPLLIMHWVEVPGGRFGCHWDIEFLGPETAPD